MKLQQLRFICEVARQGLSVSAAAEALFTAQPGVSNQIRLLEDELQVQIFKRNGKRLVGMTEAGELILKMSEKILNEVDNIKNVGAEFANEESGKLLIATTHTQARYALPDVIKRFTAQFPQVTLHIYQGNPMQIAEMVVSGTADIAIATEGIQLYEDLVMMDCYAWNHCLLAPPDHPVFAELPLTLENIAKFPIVTYDFAFSGRSKISNAFNEQGLTPNIVFTAIDSDVLKTYVEVGLGIGLVAKMAYDPKRDAGLRSEDVGNLFEPNMTHIGVRKGSYLRSYMYTFIEMFAPHLTRDVVKSAL